MNIKIASLKIAYFRRYLLLASALWLIITLTTVPTLAQTVLQGYKSDETLQKGMLVVLDDNDKSKIAAVTDKNVENLKGVVADANDSPVTLSDKDRKIFVATTGTFETLVSNENGTIESGDYIGVSSLAGIGMKANDSQPVVLGRAIDRFEGGGDSIGRGQTQDGRSFEFGRISVDLGVGDNPWRKTPDKDKVPDGVQRLANTVAQKDVSATRIYLAMLVLLISAAVAGVTLFAGVRSTIISIGRNPLSKGLIFKGLIQVTLMSLIIFITGLFGVYLLLKL